MAAEDVTSYGYWTPEHLKNSAGAREQCISSTEAYQNITEEAESEPRMDFGGAVSGRSTGW